MVFESSLDTTEARMALVRAKLAAPHRVEHPLVAVAAAALFAVSALTFAAAAIFAPPSVTIPIAKPGVQ